LTSCCFLQTLRPEVSTIQEIYKILRDLAVSDNSSNDLTELRGKIEQLEREHAQEVEQLEKKISDLERIVQQGPLQQSGEKSSQAASKERLEPDDLPLDSKGW
jgi:DNA-binding transcriptional MerR regulator